MLFGGGKGNIYIFFQNGNAESNKLNQSFCIQKSVSYYRVNSCPYLAY